MRPELAAISKILTRSAIITLASKLGIMLVNFALVVLTTHLWGGAGRGEIALVIADISIITLVSNIFCGGTISYHASRLGLTLLIATSIIGALLASFAGAILFSVMLGPGYFFHLFLISLVLSLSTTISSYWLGRSNLPIYNLLTFLLPVLILGWLLMIYFVFNKTSIDSYFNAYLAGSGILLLIGIVTLISAGPLNQGPTGLPGLKSLLSYGFSNELNSLIQFVTYRLSYFLIARYLGLTQLGIFSVAISIAEAFWVISRSFSAIHYSNIINSDDQKKNRSETITIVKQSFWITLSLLILAVFIPGYVYRFIFGQEFGEIKMFILYIIPGIAAVSASNIYDQYFSGRGNLKVIRYRLLTGLLSIAVTMPLLLHFFRLTGICIAINISYILSAIVIIYSFRKEEKAAADSSETQK